MNYGSDMGGYEALRNAILRQAVEDWMKLKKGGKLDRASISELRAFFRSKWARMLCGDVDPLYILRRLEALNIKRIYNLGKDVTGDV